MRLHAFHCVSASLLFAGVRRRHNEKHGGALYFSTCLLTVGSFRFDDSDRNQLARLCLCVRQLQAVKRESASR